MIRIDSLGRPYWYEPKSRREPMVTEAWMLEAACRGSNPDVFHPSKGGDKWSGTSLAKAICRRCPVTTQCLAWALEHKERHGVWGGFSPKERARLRREGGMTAWQEYQAEIRRDLAMMLEEELRPVVNNLYCVDGLGPGVAGADILERAIAIVKGEGT